MTPKLLNPTPVGRAGSVFLLAQAGDLAGGDLNGPAQTHDLRLDLVSEIKPLQVWFKWGVYEPTDQAEYEQALAQAQVAEKRYNPDQPRVPAGDERGGQWAPSGAGSSPAGSAGLTGPEVRARLEELEKRYTADLARLVAEREQLEEEASQAFRKQIADGVAGTEESKQIIAGMSQRIEAAYRADNDLHRKFVDDQLDLLWAETPGTAMPEFSDAITDKQREAITRGFVEFNRLAGSKATGKVLILPGMTGRAAYFSADRLEHAEASIKGAFASSQIVHELGHHFEETAPGALDKTREFYLRRTAGQDSVRLREVLPDSAYDPDEYATPDKFYDAYVGKVYYGRDDKIETTEVFSMGIEAMRYIPAKFAKADPEHFDLIWKLMRS